MIEKFQMQLQVGGWILVVVFALTGVLLLQNINRGQDVGNVSDTFSVSGTGKVSIVPDLAVADISINEEATTSSAAQDKANTKSNTVVAYLKNAGIDTADIKTSGYSVSPQYDYTDGRSILRGYQVTQSLTVKIRDMDKANTVIDGVVDAGANQVSSIRFETDEPEKNKTEARESAIADAKAKADELADQLGFRLGNIVSFSETGDAYPPVFYGRGGEVKAMDLSVASVPAPDLPVGENEVVVNVTITYQIR